MEGCSLAYGCFKNKVKVETADKLLPEPLFYNVDIKIKKQNPFMVIIKSQVQRYILTYCENSI